MTARKLALLQELLHEKALVALNKDHSVTLKESDAKQPYQIEILRIPVNSIVVKTDIFPDTRGFFYGNLGENKRADFMIFSENDEGSMVCIHIELKAGRDKWSDIVKQLKGSYALWEYMCSLNRVFKNDS